MAGSVIFTPEAEDQVAVARGSFLRSLRRRRFHVRLLVAFLFAAGVGVATEWVAGEPVAGLYVLPMIGVMAIWLPTILGVIYLLIPRRARRLFRQQKSMAGEAVFSWTGIGIDLQVRHGTSSLRWNDYHEWWQSKDVVAFGLNERLFHYVAKRTLTADQLADLLATARDGFATDVAGHGRRS